MRGGDRCCIFFAISSWCRWLDLDVGLMELVQVLRLLCVNHRWRVLRWGMPLQYNCSIGGATRLPVNHCRGVWVVVRGTMMSRWRCGGHRNAPGGGIVMLWWRCRVHNLSIVIAMVTVMSVVTLAIVTTNTGLWGRVPSIVMVIIFIITTIRWMISHVMRIVITMVTWLTPSPATPSSVAPPSSGATVVGALELVIFLAVVVLFVDHLCSCPHHGVV